VRLLVSRVVCRLRALPDIEGLKADGMVIGEGCYIGRRVVFDVWNCWLITVGESCIFSPESMVLAHDASTKRAIGYTRLRRTAIGDRVYVGARAIILPGVSVGDDAIVGAGAVVTRDVAAGTMVAGNPAQVVGSTEGYADKHRRRMKLRPVFDGDGWTMSTGITPERKAAMVDALADGEGYVP
jgi:maltose O-acetyltransferase